MLPEMIGLIRPLRIGWMNHRDIGVARGIEPVSDADIAAVTTKRKKKLSVDPQGYQHNICIPEFLEEIYDFPDGNFTLSHRTRSIGIGFKTTDAEGHVRSSGSSGETCSGSGIIGGKESSTPCAASPYGPKTTRSIRF